MAIEKITRKTKGVVYKATLYSGRKKLKTKTFPRKYEAQCWLVDEKRRLSQNYEEPDLFINESESWLRDYSKVRKAPSSHLEDIRIVHKILNPDFGDVRVDRISCGKIEHFISAQKLLGKSNATINRYLQCLKTILNNCKNRRKIVFNPFDGIKMLSEDGKDFDFFSFEEKSKFLSYTAVKYEKNDEWVHLLYLLAFNTGLRWGEITGLMWDKIDFNLGVITVARTYCTKSRSIRETTKGGKVRRVGINAKLKEPLERHFRRRPKKSDLVFQTNSGKPLNRSNFYRDCFSKDVSSVNMRKMKPHDLRHTFASHFVMRGGSLYELQKLLGHQSIKTTEMYAHLSKDHALRLTDILVDDVPDNLRIADFGPGKKSNLG